MPVFQNPFLPTVGRAGGSLLANYIPNSPEDENGILERLGGSTLGGLSYVGSVLDKPGAAIRGLASGLTGGEWGGGLLNLLPFSDTLGLTDPNERVTGRGLLEGWGAVGPNTDQGWIPDAGDLAGFGVDVLADPLTFLNFGSRALTSAGKLAEKSGTLAKAVRGADDVFGMGAREAQIAAGQRGLAQFHVPFTEAFDVALGTGQTAQNIAHGLDAMGESLRYGNLPFTKGMFGTSGLSPGRMAAQLFDKDVKNVYGKSEQIAAKEISVAQREAGEKALGQALEAYEAMKRTGLPEHQLRPLLDKAVEGVALDPAEELLLGANLPMFNSMTAGMRATEKDVFDRINLLGREIPELTPTNMGYFSRYLAEGNVKPGGLRIFPSNVDSAMHRSEEIRDVPRSLLNALGRDDINTSQIAAQLGWDPITNKKQIDDLNKWWGGMQPNMAQPGNIFGDPVRDYARYMGQMEKAIVAHEGVLDFLAKHADPVSPAAAKPGMVSIKKALTDAGFTEVDPDTGNKVFNDQTLAQLTPKLTKLGKWNLAGMQPMDFIDTLMVPQEMADSTVRLIKGFSDPEALSPVIQVYDGLQQMFKTGVTTLWPKFHTRNMVTGLWQNFVGGALDPESYSTAYKLLRGDVVQEAVNHPLAIAKGITDPQQASDLLRSNFHQYNVTGGYSIADTGGFKPPSENFAGNIIGEPGNTRSLKTGVIEGALEGASQGTNPLSKTLRGWIGGGRALGDTVEGLNRAAGFLALTKKGYSPSVAGAKARALHVDFSHLSDFERRYARRLVPFWSWSKGTLPVVLDELITRPGGPSGQVAQVAFSTRDDSEFLPEHLRGGIGIPTGEEIDGKQQFLTNIDLPIESIMEPLHSGPNAIRDTGMDLLGMLSPYIKMPLEQGFGKQLYTGRDLRDLYSSPTGNQLADQVIANSPLAGVANFSRTLLDDRKDYGTRAMNLLTGLKVSDIDLDKSRSIQAREAIEDSLRGNKGASMFEHLSVNQDELQNLSPQQLELLGLYRLLSNRAQKEAREKKKAGVP